jgi:hypothetical protein
MISRLFILLIFAIDKKNYITRNISDRKEMRNKREDKNSDSNNMNIFSASIGKSSYGLISREIPFIKLSPSVSYENHLSTLMADNNLKNEMSHNYKLTTVKKIELPKNMIPLAVGMYEQPGKVVVLEQNDKVFLYTDGLGPCIAVLLHCHLESGKRIIGVSHISIEHKTSREVARISQEKDGIKKAIRLGMFNPYKLKNILTVFKNQVESLSGKNTSKIEIYFAGGKFDRQKVLYELYYEYVNSLENIELKGYLFNPFGLTDEISHNLKLSDFWDISLTAGITSEGQPILCKTIDVSFDENISKFPDREAFDEYLRRNNIVMDNNPIKLDQTIPCFKNITLRELHTFRNAFIIQGGYGYEYYKINQDYVLTHQLVDNCESNGVRHCRSI